MKKDEPRGISNAGFVFDEEVVNKRKLSSVKTNVQPVEEIQKEVSYKFIKFNLGFFN